MAKLLGMASSATTRRNLYFLAILCSILFPSLVGIGHAARFASTSCHDKSVCPNEVANRQALIVAKDAGISNSGHRYSQHPPPQIRGEESNSVASNKQGIACDPHHSNRENYPSPSKCGPPASEEKKSSLKTDWRANTKHENMDDGAGRLNQSQRHRAPWKNGKTMIP